MQLNEIRIPLTTKGHWSAVDLGFTLARKWWLPLFLVWLIPSMLLYLVLLFVFSDMPWVSLLVVWWLKPYWDQLNLYMGSRLIFGQHVGVIETLKSGFSIVKKDWWQWITYRRISMTRSFDMPVSTLEQLGGAVRAERKSVLHQSASSAPFWLTVLTLHLEYILVYGLMALFYLMLPEHLNVNWLGWFEGEATWVSLFSNALFCLSMAVLAPFYTMSGFVLYLNRRIELEGWDIELQFRQLAQRNRERQQKRSGVAIALLLGCVFIVSMPKPAVADTTSQPLVTPTAETSRDAINDVLDAEAFHQMKTTRKWQRKDPEEIKEQNPEFPQWIISLVKFIAGVGLAIAGLATVVEGLFWVGILALVGFLVYRYRREIARLSGFFREKTPVRETPTVLFGLDVTEENLPRDISSEARSLWSAGKKRDAVSLLYRASLSKLIYSHDCPFLSSDTESECVGKVEALGLMTVSAFLSSLTESWQRIAYGHLDISSEKFASLLDSWEEVLA